MDKFQLNSKYLKIGSVVAVIIIVLLFSLYVLRPTPTKQTKAVSNPGSIAYLNQSVPIGKFVGLKNAKVELGDLIRYLPTPQLTPKVDSAKIQQTEGESGSGGSGSGEENKSYGRTIIPSVLGTVSGYTGAASFSIPINVPAGPGGVAPGVSFSYSSSSLDDDRLGDVYFRDENRYPVSYLPHGFALGGFSSIVRDTRNHMEAPEIEGDPYHRFIVSLPTGGSFEMKYNKTNNKWITIPNAFVNIEHFKPGTTDQNQPFADETSKQGHAFNYIDAGQFIITTPDGTKYYFGEANLPEKLDPQGKIIGSKEFQKETWLGTSGGNIYNEYYRSYKCFGSFKNSPCRREDDQKADHDRNTKLFVSKWLLQKTVTLDGKVINYTYDVWQRENRTGDPARQPSWLTTAAYPASISWNDGKYTVEFPREDRPFLTGEEKDAVIERINKVVVKIQDKVSHEPKIVRTYTINYFAPDETVCGVENPSKRLSFLKSIEEIGFDGTTKTPAISFCYQKFSNVGGSGDFFGKKFDNTPAVYLTEINNGYGGKTTFEYEPVTVSYLNNKNEDDETKDGRWGSIRLRIKKKTITDLSDNKSFFETYTYGEPAGYSEELGDADLEGRDGCTGCHPPTGMQFLGHSSIEINKTDFNKPEKILSHTKTNFFQANKTGTCFEPHPSKGSVSTEIVFNGSDFEASKTINQYRYRLDGKPDLTMDNCDEKRINQPVFVYLRRTDSLSQEPESSLTDFIKSNDRIFNDLKAQLKTKIRTALENIAYDEYGFPTHTAVLGEVGFDNGDDLDKTDNRHSYTYYLYDTNKWTLGIPYLSYSAIDDSCNKDEFDCQKGRTEILYDNSTDVNNQVITKGWVTENRAYLNKDLVAVSRNKFDPKTGNIIETWGPYPNKENTDKVNGDWNLIKNSSMVYDDFYKTLPIKSEDAIGIKTILENYHPFLQIPTRIRVQTNKNPEKYITTEATYDGLGRTVSSYIPDSENPSLYVNKYPASLTHYFETPDKPLIVRTMKLVSDNTKSTKSNDKYYYTTSDSFYDGLGNIREAQSLSTDIQNSLQKTVALTQYSAGGQIDESYDIQTTLSTELEGLYPSSDTTHNNTDIISSNPPKQETVAKIPVAKSVYDNLGRPIQNQQINSENGQTFTTYNYYVVNAQKIIEPKGVEKISISDVWGRNTYSAVINKEQNKILINKNTYEAPLVDNPTKTEIYSPSHKDTITITAKYDSAGRLMESNDPSLGNFKFSYDILGNKIKEEKTGGVKTSFTYDNAGRLIKQQFNGEKLYANVVNNRKTIEMFYDGPGSYALGKLVKVTYPTGQTEYSYDKLQRTTKTIVTTFDKTKSFETKYNGISQILSSIGPDLTLQYQYDRLGKTNSIKSGGKEMLGKITYNKYGNVVESGVIHNNLEYKNKNVYDNMGRLKNLTVSNMQGDLLKQDFSYNQFMEIDGITEHIAGKTENFRYEYDGFSQLTAMYSGTDKIGTYEYDIYGRILNKKEGDNTVKSVYSASNPFFAPKAITLNSSLLKKGVKKEISIPDEGAIRPNVKPSITPVTVSPLVTGVSEGAGSPLIGGTTLQLSYTDKGALKEDSEACYEYNGLNQLITLYSKKNATDKCPLSTSKTAKIMRFYYDFGGTLVLQEEYKPSDTQNPIKQTYLFGSFEEVYERK